jgi:SAM-dependent methyltransferase
MSWGERTVEVPWFLDKVNTEGSILDIGSAESNYHHDLLRMGVPKLVLNDIRDFSCFEDDDRVTCVVGDSRKLSKAEMGGQFDTVLCISTLEHVALTAYDQQKDYTGHVYDAQLEALDQMISFVKDGGEFILTVPYGKYEHGGWVIVYNKDVINRIKTLYNVEVETYFTLTNREDDVWIECTQDECPPLGMDHFHGHMRATSCACLIIRK